MTTGTPTYSWQAVATAEQYYLWVQDSTGLKVSQWYTAAQVICGSGAGTCSVNPFITLATGVVSWRVRTWNSAGYGAYAGPQPFTVVP